MSFSLALVKEALHWCVVLVPVLQVRSGAYDTPKWHVERYVSPDLRVAVYDLQSDRASHGGTEPGCPL